MILTPAKALDYLCGPGLSSQKAVFYDGDMVFIGDREDAPCDILKLDQPDPWTEISMNELGEIVDPPPPYNHGDEPPTFDVIGRL